MIMTSGHITSWLTEWEKVEAVTDIIFLGYKITVDGDCNHKIKNTWSILMAESEEELKSLLMKARHPGVQSQEGLRKHHYKQN